MKVIRKNLVSLFTGIVILFTTGCTPETPRQETRAENATDNAAKTSEINLYSSRHYDTDNALYKDFTQKTGVKVNLIEGDADQLIERIKSEGANSPADVFIAVDAGRIWRAQEAGTLQPISSKKLESAIPENLRSPEGYWFGLSKRARVIVYHKNRVNPNNLSTYEALAQPQWQDKVCVRSSENIYNQSLVAWMIEKDGVQETEKWLKGLVKNFARPPEGNDISQLKDIAAGECDLALVNHYYVARLKQSNDPEDKKVASQIGVFFPNQKQDGTHVNISGAGVVAGAPNKESAIAFLEYLATPGAQEIFANANNEIPVISGMKPNETVASFGNFKGSTVNVAAYGENNPEAVKLMDSNGWK
jgi:iron(III) transport system substrate-binding protein